MNALTKSRYYRETLFRRVDWRSELKLSSMGAATRNFNRGEPQPLPHNNPTFREPERNWGARGQGCWIAGKDGWINGLGDSVKGLVDEWMDGWIRRWMVVSYFGLRPYLPLFFLASATIEMRTASSAVFTGGVPRTAVICSLPSSSL